MKRFARDENGVAAVVAALFIVILVGFSAIVIDYGNLASHKGALQNAVDAACLAAAQSLPDNPTQAAAVAEEYLAANAPGALLQSVTFQNGDKKVTVTASWDVDYTFARAFMGDDSKSVTARASASVANVFDPIHYALFSGSEIDLLQFTGKNYISGDVHSNNSVKNIATIDGTVTAAGTIDGKIVAQNKVPGYNVLKMPDFSKIIDLSATVSGATLLSYGATYKNGTYTMSPIQLNAMTAAYSDKTIYVDGNVVINGSGVCATGCLIVTGSITFNGGGVSMSAGDAICLASLSGDITFNGGGGVFNGILFAPNGGVTFNGKTDVINGSVLADTIRGNGGLNINFNSNAYNSIPEPDIMLV
jgi:Flp pilus assembly protein TadG